MKTTLLAHAFLQGIVSVMFISCDVAPKVEKKSSASAVKQEDSTTILTWEASDDVTIVSYKIFLGSSAKEEGSLLETVDARPGGPGDFDPAAPMVKIDTRANGTLAEFRGLKACFSISAVDDEGLESDRTNPVCSKLLPTR